jgi:hypothetical protein
MMTGGQAGFMSGFAINATLNKLSVAIFRFVFVNQSTMEAKNKDQSEMRTGSGDA